MEIEDAFAATESLSDLSAILDDANANLIVNNGLWEGRRVSSKRYEGSIELFKVERRITELFWHKKPVLDDKANTALYIKLTERIKALKEKTSSDLTCYGGIFEAFLYAIDQELKKEEFDGENLPYHVTKEFLFQSGFIPNNVWEVINSDREKYGNDFDAYIETKIIEDWWMWNVPCCPGCPECVDEV